MLVALQIAAIAALGVVSAVRFHVFAAVDELAHVSYVQDVAEQGALPWEGRTYVSWQMEAIEQDTYPQHSTVDPRHYGLAGYSYEAFQPPLYYLLAVPVFAIPSNYRDKVIAVRLLDVVLLLAAVALLALLARALSLEHRWELLAAALAVLLWPGIIVRTVTVSNAALELPITLLVRARGLARDRAALAGAAARRRGAARPVPADGDDADLPRRRCWRCRRSPWPRERGWREALAWAGAGGADRARAARAVDRLQRGALRRADGDRAREGAAGAGRQPARRQLRARLGALVAGTLRARRSCRRSGGRSTPARA